jgi:hypothetical protein
MRCYPLAGVEEVIMSKVLLSESTEAKAAVSALFDNAPPVLVEVRFPQMGTSSDWYLCEDEEHLEQILERIGPGAELRLNSVWDLENRKGAVCLKK